MSRTTQTTITTTVRKVEAHEYKRAAQVLAEAFGDDKVSCYFSDCDGNTREQAKKLEIEIYEYIVYAHILKGVVLTIGDFEGISCWMPPGQNMDDWWTIIRSGMWRLNFSLGKEGKKRYFDEFLPLLHDTKAECMGDRDDKSWYLVYIGTLPSARGKGYGRKLIEYATDLADKDGLACYLEATTPGNLAVYKKLGFEYIKTIELKRSDEPIPMMIMKREPKK
ncbi:hypothetical protein TRVA0_050S01068 [Trichomonascus vanleenenianus]|uniref:GNAT family N-acetyltransferase n=1 Tax=Trichomonascus vanleenenianus TaxID=2268995 RepID=UPI003ECA7D40